MLKYAATVKNMNLDRRFFASYIRLAIGEALIITFITFSSLPSARSATFRGNVSPRTVGGSAVVAAQALLVGLIWVNTISDAVHKKAQKRQTIN